jgi:Cu(I)/Ag(I) efflux system membrane fusion protein
VLRSIRVSGVVEDDDARHRILSATVPGRIERLHVNWEGAEVVEGQPLATFYSPDLGSVVGEYRALARGGAASPALLEAAENRLRQRGLSKAQIDRMRTDTGLDFEILAPRTGTVTRRHVYEGQYVAEGTRLFELADFSRMWLQFSVSEQDLPWVAVGVPVEIRLPSLPGRVFRAGIGFINPNLDPLTRTVKVRVELENPVGKNGKHLGHEILHLSVALGRIEVGGEALAVPREAVLWTGAGARVYVERAPGTYERREVDLGRVGDRFWEVQSGLKEGERVVVESNLLLDSQAQLDFSGTAPDQGGNQGAERGADHGDGGNAVRDREPKELEASGERGAP